MAEPLSTSTAAGVALIKIFGLPVGTGALAAALGFMFLWPTTKREAFARFASSIISSATAGPLLVVWLRSYMPSMFDGAKEVAILYGAEPAVGFLFVAAPVMVAAGLPAWWLIGALVRWLDKRKDKDLGELAADAAAAVHAAREAM